jgi:hypothetical protein
MNYLEFYSKDKSRMRDVLAAHRHLHACWKLEHPTDVDPLDASAALTLEAFFLHLRIALDRADEKGGEAE